MDASEKELRDRLLEIIHELRSPLNVIIGFANLIKNDTQLDSETRQFAKDIEEGGWRMEELTKEIIALCQKK